MARGGAIAFAFVLPGCRRPFILGHDFPPLGVDAGRHARAARRGTLEMRAVFRPPRLRG